VAYPKRAKKTDDLTVFLLLLGSAGVKALRKMLVRSTPLVVLLHVKTHFDENLESIKSQFAWKT